MILYSSSPGHCNRHLFYVAVTLKSYNNSSWIIKFFVVVSFQNHYYIYQMLRYAYCVCFGTNILATTVGTLMR